MAQFPCNKIISGFKSKAGFETNNKFAAQSKQILQLSQSKFSGAINVTHIIAVTTPSVRFRSVISPIPIGSPGTTGAQSDEGPFAFQFLIGSLESKMKNFVWERKEFQFLIGSLGTTANRFPFPNAVNFK